MAFRHGLQQNLSEQFLCALSAEKERLAWLPCLNSIIERVFLVCACTVC